jgi:endonuclease/exonuclease/phosphatase family metal-dependent hydrolase
MDSNLTKPSLRIATWNIERPTLNGWKRNPRIAERIREIDADVWILTETNASIIPTSSRFPQVGYVSLASLPTKDLFHKLGESCTTIWSRYGIKQAIETFEANTAVCAEIDTPIGRMIVYGTILTYANDTGPNGKSKKWVEHRKAIADHRKDWADIAAAFPRHSLCIAGDFNTSFCDNYYAAEINRSDLLAVLEMLGMKNLTAEVQRNIDHIAVTQTLVKGCTVSVTIWNEDKQLSDHIGICVEMAPITT